MDQTDLVSQEGVSRATKVIPSYKGHTYIPDIILYRCGPQQGAGSITACSQEENTRRTLDPKYETAEETLHVRPGCLSHVCSPIGSDRDLQRPSLPTPSARHRKECSAPHREPSPSCQEASSHSAEHFMLRGSRLMCDFDRCLPAQAEVVSPPVFFLFLFFLFHVPRPLSALSPHCWLC